MALQGKAASDAQKAAEALSSLVSTAKKNRTNCGKLLSNLNRFLLNR
jgi:hypothetical protein